MNEFCNICHKEHTLKTEIDRGKYHYKHDILACHP